MSVTTMDQTPHRDPYGSALSALRRFAHDGRFGWGDPLVVKDLAEEIGLSPTPVREALARLSGEGLIERRRGRGYFFPALSAADIIDLFDLQRSYVYAALTLHPPSSARRHKIGASGSEMTFATLFETLVRETSNDALVAVYSQLLERMTPVLRALEALNPQLSPTAAQTAERIAAGQTSDAVALIEAHHRQRSELASELARFLQKSASSIV